MIRSVQINDAKALLDIYNHYVLNTTATFDIEPLTLHVFIQKIEQIVAEYPFIVFEKDNDILGYAYGSKFRPKPAYNHTVESTVYVKHNVHGKQIGTKLYAKLLELLGQSNFHIVLGVLTLPNEASVNLHKKFGFKQVAEIKEVGLKFHEWQNIGIWQLNL